jgi:predicted GNAT family acetyltransferase
MSTDVDVRHAPHASRFEAVVEGELCRLDYRLDADLMRIHHTAVPSRLEGRGIAAALTRSAVEHARAEGLRIEPLCGYVRAWMTRHPEYADLIAR